MTKDEFQRRYYDYRTRDKEAAVREAMKIKVDGGEAVVVEFTFSKLVEYGIMLRAAADHFLNMFPFSDCRIVPVSEVIEEIGEKDNG